MVKDERHPVSLRYCVQEDSPLDLVLLFELSEMMAANWVALRGATEVAMSAAREGDRLGAMTFSDGARLEVPLSNDLKEVKPRIRSGLAYATFEGKPFVLSAVAEAAKYQAGQRKPHGRPAVLMFGANTGFGAASSHAGATTDLWDADTILSGVVIPTSWTRVIYDQNPYHILGMMNLPAIFPRFDYVDDVTAQTGGEMIYTEGAGAMKQTHEPYVSLRLAIQHMRRRYKLYYDLPEAKVGQRRRVQVEPSPAARRLHPEARIIARTGYTLPKTGGHVMRVSLLLAYLMISATAAGQGPPAKDDPSPNFRVGTRVGVTIAAIRSAKKLGILDWGSTPVGDLRATDLRLFDSDKRQEITSLEKLGQGGAPQAGDSVEGPDNRLSTRTSIILLDALNTSFSDQIYGREGVSRMLSKLPAGHRIAIFAFGGLLHLLHDFSTDYGSLRTAVEKYEGELPPTGVGNSPFGSRDKATTPGTAASAIHVPGSAILAAFDQRNRILGTLQALTEIAHSTKNYPGQKNLLWLSGVVPTQFTIYGQASARLRRK